MTMAYILYNGHQKMADPEEGKFCFDLKLVWLHPDFVDPGIK